MHGVMFERGIGMKKLTKKSRILSLVARGVLVIIILAAVRYAVILLVFWINPIGGREHNRRPNDELSRSVKEAVGDDFYYQGKEKYDSGVTEYQYTVKNEQGKITVWVGIKIPGGLEDVLYLENFSDEGLDEADYDGMYAIHIRKPDTAHDTCFDSPSVYTEIEGIRKLTINAEMKKQAEKEGIDWYELWPDLEEVKVVPR